MPATEPHRTRPGPSGPHHNYASWNDVPTGERNWLQDMEDVWGRWSGFANMPTEQQLLDAANAGVTSQTEFGRYMWDHGMGTAWAAVGMDQQTYNQRTHQYAAKYRELTGQDLPIDLQPGDDPALVDFWFESIYQGLSAADFGSALQHDEYMRNTYGWLKHGLTFDEFGLKKDEMRHAFGHDLSNEEATLQLDYFKRAQGSGSQAGFQPSGQQQKQPAQEAMSEVR